MKVAIMQPYFLPYIGYWQLLNAVDQFIVYDNIQYTKKGWVNRNRFLQNGKASLFTIPLKKDSSVINIKKRSVASDYNRKKQIDRLANAYKQAPYFDEVFPLIANIFNNKNDNLFDYILGSINAVCRHLGIDNKKIVASSTLPIDHSLKAEKKVLSICQELGAVEYWNPIGGTALYDKKVFQDHEINLYFLQTNNIEYQQLASSFVPALSIIDLIMFNNKEQVGSILTQYTLH